ncbi:MAG: phytochelatin synthase family protein [Pseudomonadota bacterium]
MMRINKLLRIGFLTSSIAGLTLLVLGLSYIIYPFSDPQPIPDNLNAQYDSLSKEFLVSSEYSADYIKLNGAFEPQIYRSFCGVASSVIVLKALGSNVDQKSFFSNQNASKIRPLYKVFFTGMPLSDLSELIESYGASTHLYYASDLNIDEFRTILKRNMQNPDNFILVNYLRSTLGQENVGHISPIGSYNPETDEVLIMDVTTYNYPHVWASVESIYDAMDTMDDKLSRGFLEIF